MKIIHTADIHLDSPLSQVKDSATRRYELLLALSNLSEYANNNDVKAIIVAGDLFDNQFATDSTIAGVAEIIRSSKASWFILQGNHGSRAPYAKLKGLAPQANVFDDDWSYLTLDNVTICGRELGVDDAVQYGKLILDKNRYNIVVLHGDVDDDSYGLIDKKALVQSGANYVALGHRHTLVQYNFNGVKACYCGALEPRGFDEPSQTGFVVIDTDKDKFTYVEQHIRRIESIKVDVTGVANDIALSGKITDAIGGLSNRNYLNIVFCGAISSGVHLDVVCKNVLSDRFFALRIDDQTTVNYDLKAIQAEVSLRGEFVKLANKIEDESLKSAVIKMGLQALFGEEIS